MNVPDTGTLTRRLMGTRWTHYKLEHLHDFDRSSLGRRAAQTGFATMPLRLTIGEMLAFLKRV